MSSQDDSSSIRTASKPFCNPQADLILRTSDLVDFRVRSQILEEATFVFKDIAERPPSPLDDALSTDHADFPIVIVTEDSQTWDLLLRLIYPTADPVFRSIHEVRAVLEAAIKYKMENQTQIMRTHLINFSLADAHPLRVFAIACHQNHSFEPEAKTAANLIRNLGLDKVEVPELAEISAGCYHRLLQYVDNPLAEITSSISLTSFCHPPAPPVNWNRDRMQKHFNASGAPHPYNSAALDADAVLHTSDGVDFRIHTVILRIASPVFRDLISDRESAVGRMQFVDGLRMFQVSEDSFTLFYLLQFCYAMHIDQAFWDEPSAIRMLLLAAIKYQATSVIRTCIKVANLDPVRLFAIACVCLRQLGDDSESSRAIWRDMAQDAARTTLKKGLDGLKEYVEELEEITALDYHRLRQYHERCSQAARAAVLHFLTHPESASGAHTWTWQTCGYWFCPADASNSESISTTPKRKPRAWWCNYVRSVADVLARTPWSGAAQASGLQQQAVLEASVCPNCKHRAISELGAFNDILVSAVESALEPITVDIV